VYGCQFVDSHKSIGSGPIHSPVCNPSKKIKNTKQTTKADKQKHENNKPTTKTKKQSKDKTTKNTKKWDRYQQWGFMRSGSSRLPSYVYILFIYIYHIYINNIYIYKNE